MFAILTGLNARHPLASTATPLVFALGAGALGFVTNGSGLLIFGSTEFVFGGFFSILSALLLGPWWGGLTALIAFSRTVETWGHPTGLFCFTVEAVVLGWLVTRQKWNPLLALAAAWAVIGLLISTSYFIFGDKTPIPCNLGTVLAYGANGFFMTLAALLVRTDVRTATTRLSDSSRALADTTAHRDELARQLEELRHTFEDSVQARTEQLRQAVAAAESAGQAKSDFLAGMSHELRTPLNVIMGNAALLQEQDLGAGTTAQRESLRDIELSGQHLLTLITDVLDLSRIEAGLLELTIQPTPIAETCESALRFMRDTATRKQILVTFESHHQTKVVPLDGRRLKQILINLLANAIKSTPEGGRIELLVTETADPGMLHCTVRNFGIGTDPAAHSKLFRPFVQIDESTSRRNGGARVGLVVAQRLVELHGGSISLANQPGSGSAFMCSFPVRAAAPRLPRLLETEHVLPEPAVQPAPLAVESAALASFPSHERA